MLFFFLILFGRILIFDVLKGVRVNFFGQCVRMKYTELKSVLCCIKWRVRHHSAWTGKGKKKIDKFLGISCINCKSNKNCLQEQQQSKPPLGQSFGWLVWRARVGAMWCTSTVDHTNCESILVLSVHNAFSPSLSLPPNPRFYI